VFHCRIKDVLIANIDRSENDVFEMELSIVDNIRNLDEAKEFIAKMTNLKEVLLPGTKSEAFLVI